MIKTKALYALFLAIILNFNNSKSFLHLNIHLFVIDLRVLFCSYTPKVSTRNDKAKPWHRRRSRDIEIKKEEDKRNLFKYLQNAPNGFAATLIF